MGLGDPSIKCSPMWRTLSASNSRWSEQPCHISSGSWHMQPCLKSCHNSPKGKIKFVIILKGQSCDNTYLIKWANIAKKEPKPHRCIKLRARPVVLEKSKPPVELNKCSSQHVFSPLNLPLAQYNIHFPSIQSCWFFCLTQNILP